MKQIKVVLFDLDGTLIDSEYFYFSNWSPILKEKFNIDISFDDWLTDFAGHTLVRNVGFLKDKFQVDTTEEFMWKETRARYANSNMKAIRLMPNAREVLGALRDRNIRIGLVTSSYISTVETVLGHHDLLSFFEFFVTRESVDNPKPDAEPYLLGIEKMGLSKENIIAVEDTITGVTAAKASGLFCIGVSNQPIERSRIKAKADVLLHDLIEVIDYVEN